MHHLGKGGTYLSVTEVGWQFLIPGHQGQRLHGGHTVRRRASDNGERTFRRDETFKDQGELLRPFQGTVVVFLVVETRVVSGVNHRLQCFQIHSVEDIAAVIVESEHGTVGIPAIAHIPLFDLTASGVDAKLIERSFSLRQQTLDRRREKEPVGVRRINLAHALELLDIPLLGDIIKRYP